MICNVGGEGGGGRAEGGGGGGGSAIFGSQITVFNHTPSLTTSLSEIGNASSPSHGGPLPLNIKCTNASTESYRGPPSPPASPGPSSWRGVSAEVGDDEAL